MNFANSSVAPSNVAFNASNYAGALPSASGIYKLGTGQYAVVLDGSINLSGIYEGTVIENTATTATNYIDVWTVKMAQTSDYKTYINEFKLYDDTLFTTTQPIVFTTSNKLRNKHVKLGSKVDLTISTEFNIGNKDIDSSIMNIFRESVIVNPSIQIIKLNDDYTLPARVTVSAFADTSAYTDLTSDNTIIFNWDTNSLYTLPTVLNGTFGPLTGAYQIQVKYSVLNQVILSDYLNLIVS
jgi:ATP sulfurylase